MNMGTWWKERSLLPFHSPSTALIVGPTMTNNPRRNPTGFQQFYQALKDFHTPTSFIHNKEMMQHSEEQGGRGFVVQRQTDGAPPNYQPPKKKRATKTNIKWLKF